MNSTKRSIGRIALYLGVIGAMVASIAPATVTPAAAQEQSRRINNFTVSGRFLEEWSKQGSEQNNVYVNGLPITERRPEINLTDGRTYETQWFERARYEAHPENQAPYDVLFGLLGVTLTEGRGSIDPATNRVRNPADQPFVGVDRPADVGPNKVWFQETRHTISGKILEYWNRYGGLKQFGFPLSEQFQEISATDGKTYTVQYFERNRFELHPEKAAPYEVELGLLGVQQYKMTPVPASDLPSATPRNVTSTKNNAIVAFSQEPPNLLFTESLFVTSMVRDLIEDGLVGADEKTNYFPENAYFIPTLENGGSYYVGFGADRHLVTKYKIRRGIKWTDGRELTSNDAVFAYSYLMNPKTPVPDRSTLQKIFNLENPDKYTVIYNWMSLNQGKEFLARVPNKEDYAFVQVFVDKNTPIVDPAYFLIGVIYPQHILQNVDPTRLPQHSYAREGHVGTGPYRLERWVTGQEMTLTRNPNYSLHDRPILERIVIRFIGNTDQIIAQLRTGDIDAATSDAFPGPTEALDQLPPTLKVDAVPATTWEHVDFNFRYPPFQDRAVREAVLLAINRQQIVDTAYRGRTVPLRGPVPPVAWYSLENPDFAKNFPDVANRFKLPDYPLRGDPARANQILDQAGWARGPDGIRAKGGQRLSFELATTTGNRNREISTQLMQQDLARVGMEVKLAYYRATEYFATTGQIARGVCQLCLFAWVQSQFSDFNVWTAKSIPTEADPSGQNRQHYNNPKLDQLNDQFNSEIDRAKQAPFAAEIQVLMMTDIVLVPLYPRANIEVYKTSLQNHKTPNSNNTVFWNVNQWFFR